MLLCTLTGANRKTIIEWDKELPSPIADEQGLEHGGIKNGDLYKIYNNEQLTQAQHSKLGINIGVTKNWTTSLNLLKSDHHYKTTLEALLKVHAKTLGSFVFFIYGSLPLQATLDLRQLGLFPMISRLMDNILNKIAMHLLISSPDSSRSWFVQDRKSEKNTNFLILLQSRNLHHQNFHSKF